MSHSQCLRWTALQCCPTSNSTLWMLARLGNAVLVQGACLTQALAETRGPSAMLQLLVDPWLRPSERLTESVQSWPTMEKTETDPVPQHATKVAALQLQALVAQPGA